MGVHHAEAHHMPRVKWGTEPDTCLGIVDLFNLNQCDLLNLTRSLQTEFQLSRTIIKRVREENTLFDVNSPKMHFFFLNFFIIKVEVGLYLYTG